MQTQIRILRYVGDPGNGGGYRLDGESSALDLWTEGADALPRAFEFLHVNRGLTVIQLVQIPNPRWESYPHYGLLCTNTM